MNLKNQYYYFKSAISPEDCQKIIELGNKKISDNEKLGISSAGVTFDNAEKQSRPDAQPSKDLTLNQLSKNNIKQSYVRDSNIAWLNDQWIYDLVLPYIKNANMFAGWRWEINGYEQLQFTKYKKNGFYGWHEDGQSDWYGIYKRYIPGISKVSKKSNGQLPSGYSEDENLLGKVRKISMTLNLNNPNDYEGGDLKFDFGLHTEEKNRFHVCEEIRPTGSLIIFPSFLKHCVTPVIKGTRYSLVLWTLGEPWK